MTNFRQQASKRHHQGHTDPRMRALPASMWCPRGDLNAPRAKYTGIHRRALKGI
jgi:hypothetical protein